MKQSVRFFLFTWLAIGLGARAPAQQPKPAGTLEELQARLTGFVSQPRFAAGLLGVKVVSLDTGRTLFEHEAGKLFSPASNSKLYTVALALDQLGGEYRIKTSLYAAAKPDAQGTIQGDFIIYGRGDPTLNARRHGGDIFKALQPLVATLTNAGVRRIQGDLIGDESFIRGNPYGSGWDCDDLQYYYGAEISALTINDNTLQLSVKPGETAGVSCKLALVPATSYLILSNRTETVQAGGRREISLYRPLGQNVLYVSGQLPLDDLGYTREVTVHHPAGLFCALFREALARNGITLDGRPRTMNWLDRQVLPFEPDKFVEFGSVESPPMRELAREIQKPSQNLYTDLILAHIGSLALATNKSSTVTSEDSGIRQLYAFLNKAGIPRGDLQFEEGSGLSRNNLTTPNATLALLQFMHGHAESEAFLNALPVAGVDGTLRARMRDTAAAGNVRAKTGTLRWANALSGHVTTAAGERLIFSIMLNRYVAGSNPPARGEIDKLAVMLAEFAGRSDK
ncbi:MAG: D-alanyl-D-alanine carboxypeptidase/D-alanyl-D-alanine-endopeptidase [Verrucomicrobia bacterium]|nr:D-alanyl-D-alanine carboxypeptidase/D-alanyl-D-alanine-endopeptidase [Verrucomicrobiota bacterium]